MTPTTTFWVVIRVPPVLVTQCSLRCRLRCGLRCRLRCSLRCSLAWSRSFRAPMPARAPTHRAARRRTALGAARAELAALRRREADARGAAEARERRLADLAAGADELARKAAELRAELGAPLHAQLSDDERAELAALGPRLKQLQARPLSLRCAVCQLCCSGRPRRDGAGGWAARSVRR
jgi:hypothetical protein